MIYYSNYKQYDDTLSFELNLVLSVFKGLKSFARKEEFLRDYAKHYGKRSHYDLPESIYSEATKEAVSLGLLKQAKNGSLRLDKKGYSLVGSYFGAEADAKRRMWSDSFRESCKAFSN